MSKKLIQNNKNWKIKTDIGFVDFDGISTMGHKKIFRVFFDDHSFIDASANHVFFTKDKKEISTKEIINGIELVCEDKNKKVIDVEYIKTEETYDIINVDTHTFYANGVLSHNCEFISSDNSLFDTQIIQIEQKRFENIQPAFSMNGEQDFYKPLSQDMCYIVGVDPSTGNGNDYSVIEVFEFPTMQQVMEFRSNTVSEVVLYSHLKKVLGFLERYSDDVYFSIESNGVGRALISLYMQDENPPMYAHFMSEQGKNKLGYTTTNTTKKDTSIRFKNMFERREMTIYSQILYNEMKSYIRKGDTFEAQTGATDDCISAVFIILRMLDEIAMYDPRAYDKLYRFSDQAEGDEWYTEYDDDMPLPGGMF